MVMKMQEQSILNLGLNLKVGNNLMQMSEILQRLAVGLESAIEPFERIATSLTKSSLKYTRLKELQYKPFIENGLWLAPSMLPNIINIAIEKYEQGKKSAIPSIIEGYYRRNDYEVLRCTVSRWDSLLYFSNRMHIFKDALDAHISKKWTLTIPSLLPHVEGIAGEILRANDIRISRKNCIFSDGAKTVPSRVFSSLQIPDNFLRYTIVFLLIDYLERALYPFVDFNNPKIRRFPKLNRNAVLHGYQLNYATRMNSLRCFLALDSLSMLIGNHPRFINCCNVNSLPLDTQCER